MSATLNPAELVILLVLLRNGEGNALRVKERLQRAGVSCPFFLYSRLRRLESAGLLSARWVEGDPERGGRPERRYSLTDSARDALQRVLP